MRVCVRGCINDNTERYTDRRTHRVIMTINIIQATFSETKTEIYSYRKAANKRSRRLLEHWPRAPCVYYCEAPCLFQFVLLILLSVLTLKCLYLPVGLLGIYKETWKCSGRNGVLL